MLDVGREVPNCMMGSTSEMCQYIVKLNILLFNQDRCSTALSWSKNIIESCRRCVILFLLYLFITLRK